MLVNQKAVKTKAVATVNVRALTILSITAWSQKAFVVVTPSYS